MEDEIDSQVEVWKGHEAWLGQGISQDGKGFEEGELMAKKRHYYAYKLKVPFTTKKEAQSWANFINDELDKTGSKAGVAKVEEREWTSMSGKKHKGILRKVS